MLIVWVRLGKLSIMMLCWGLGLGSGGLVVFYLSGWCTKVVVKFMVFVVSRLKLW